MTGKKAYSLFDLKLEAWDRSRSETDLSTGNEILSRRWR